MIDKNDSNIIKGIAILLIFISHTAGIIGVRWFTPLGGIGVSIFLFISGYGLTKSFLINKLCYFWTKRFISVYPAYLIITIIYAFINKSYSIKNLIIALFFLKPIILYGWYFQYLFMMYVLFWVTHYFLEGKTVYLIMMIVSLIGLWFLPEIMAEQSLSFIMGAFYSEYEFSIKEAKPRIISLANATVLIIISGTFLAIKQCEIIRELPQVIFNVVQLLVKLPAALALIMLTALPIKKNVLILEWLGIISYEYFLVHGFFLEKVEITSIFTLGEVIIGSCGCAIILHLGNKFIGTELSNTLMKS